MLVTLVIWSAKYSDRGTWFATAPGSPVTVDRDPSAATCRLRPVGCDPSTVAATVIGDLWGR